VDAADRADVYRSQHASAESGSTSPPLGPDQSHAALGNVQVRERERKKLK